MRTTACLILVASLVVIADVSAQCSERINMWSAKRNDEQVRLAVEDWAIPNYLACGLGVAALVWGLAASVSGAGRLGSLARPIARLGIFGAVAVGLGLVVGLGGWFLAAGKYADYGDGSIRYNLESLWLIGAVIGGGTGTAIGAGLGGVALGRSRRQDAQPSAKRDGGDR